MPNEYVDIETLKFLLFQVQNVREVLDQERFSEYDEEAIEMFIDSVKDFADKEMFPFFKEMDENPAHFEDGEIIVHPQVNKYMQQAGEMGFVGAPFDYEIGGLQMPSMAVNASAFIQEAANNHLPGYVGLTLGAAELIIHFANASLNETYVPK